VPNHSRNEPPTPLGARTVEESGERGLRLARDTATSDAHRIAQRDAIGANDGDERRIGLLRARL
jgi:hypothetical protein